MTDHSQWGQQASVTDFFQGRVGILADIGANDGVTFSNSRALLENGWRGVLIEPNPATFLTLKENIVGLPNCIAVSVACANVNGIGIFSVPPLETDPEGMTARLGVKKDTNDWEIIHVPVMRFGDLYPWKVNLLMIDAEGADKSVLEGVRWSVNAPDLVLVETVVVGEAEITQYMNSVGYKFLHTNTTDTYYIPEGMNIRFT